MFATIIAGFPLSVSAQTTLLGIYEGNQGWDMARVRALETWQGRGHAVLLLFTSWDPAPKTRDNLFGQQLPAIWNNGNVPVITWEPFTGNRTEPDIVQQIATGRHDAYIASWAAGLRGFLAGPDRVLHTYDDRRAYIRLAHEMNGDWYPWGQAPPGDYVEMWRRVRRAFEDLGLGTSHLQWVWTVNHADVGFYAAEQYYPGDAWVDWVGLDGYNWGASKAWSTWTTPAEVFTPMLDRLRAISGRPMSVTETSSTAHTAGGASLAAKNEWIRQFFAWAPRAGLRMVCWFNADTDADFSVFGGRTGDVVFRTGRTSYRAYSAYRQSIAAGDTLLSSSGTDPRLLSDAAFEGR